MSIHFSLFTQTALSSLLNTRVGEVKLGEKIQLPKTIDWAQAIKGSSARFVLLGIPEDIGVRANNGIGGADTAWLPALKSLLNIQSTTQFDGSEILLLGSFSFKQWMQDAQSMSIEQLRLLVTQIDEEVYPLIQSIVANGKIPIVIGGGHNNAFPLLKGSALALNKEVNCINLDAHSDYRTLEGRHSGNGFRYAKTNNFLGKYALIGLHENYNSTAVIADLAANKDIHFSFYEDIFIRKQYTFESAMQDAFTHTKGIACGIELDLDSIENTLSSAYSPSGISVLQARQFVYAAAQNTQAAYLHLAEAATKLCNGLENQNTGKLLAYLISDFVKGTLINTQ